MIISEKELRRRLESTKNLANTLSIPQAFLFSKNETLPGSISSANDGQGSAHTDLHTSQRVQTEEIYKQASLAPESLKVIGASLVRQGVAESVVCRELGVSPIDIQTANQKQVQTSIEKVRELALNKLLISLNLMTADKFESASLKELSNCTANLSRVIEKTSPRELNDNRVQFLVYSPGVKSLDSFPVVDV